MKRRVLVLVALLALAFFSTPGAATLIGTTNDLANSNPQTEAAWLASLLTSVQINPSTVSFYTKFEDGSGYSFGRSLRDYDPGFDWEYAVVKYGRNWAAFTPESAGLLDVDSLSKDISHVSWFNVSTRPGPSPVPEPSTLLPLASGLVGVGVFASRKVRKR